MDTFVKVINEIRDILRKDGITGMESINHCLCFITIRSLTTAKCEKLGIDKMCAYENIMVDAKGEEIDELHLYDRFYCQAKTNCFIGQMVIVLKFAIFRDFKINLTPTLMQIMRLIGKIDINKLALDYDIVGLVYEMHLRSGSSTATRDLGQYFTDRRVIKFMIDLCKPTIKNGVIETICDPTCGTAGFLCMSVKYLNSQATTNNEKIDWMKNKSRIYGCDIDANVASMAKLNLILETGEFFDIQRNDSLYNDIKNKDGKITRVDIVLANEPFGVKQIVHANCCDKVKDLKIRGTKSEPLFLQLMMQSLTDTGRCAVIVPNGVLFTSSGIHKLTRKYLLENFNLQKIISLDGDFFMNTGVSASIMFFSRGNTKEVEFSKIQLVNNKIVETSIVKVLIDDIKKDNFSLFVNKYSIAKQVKIEGVTYKKIGEVCEVLNGYAFKSDEYVDKGVNIITIKNIEDRINIIKCSKIMPNNKYNKYVIKKGDILMSLTGNIKIGVYLFQERSYMNQRVIKFYNFKNILPQYFYYLVKSNFIETIQQQCAGSVQGNVSSSIVLNIEIPVPDISVQNQMVPRLNFIFESIKTSERKIKELEKENKLCVECYTFGAETKKLGDILDFLPSTKHNTSIGKLSGKYRFYNSSQNDRLYVDKFEVNKESIIIGNGGNFCIHFDKTFTPSKHVTVCHNKDDTIILLKYVYHYLYYNKNLLDEKGAGSTITWLNRENIKSIEIPVPNMDISELNAQKVIIELCDENNKIILHLKLEITKLKNYSSIIFKNYLKMEE